MSIGYTTLDGTTYERDRFRLHFTNSLSLQDSGCFNIMGTAYSGGSESCIGGHVQQHVLGERRRSRFVIFALFGARVRWVGAPVGVRDMVGATDRLCTGFFISSKPR